MRTKPEDRKGSVGRRIAIALASSLVLNAAFGLLFVWFVQWEPVAQSVRSGTTSITVARIISRRLPHRFVANLPQPPKFVASKTPEKIRPALAYRPLARERLNAPLRTPSQVTISRLPPSTVHGTVRPSGNAATDMLNAASNSSADTPSTPASALLSSAEAASPVSASPFTPQTPPLSAPHPAPTPQPARDPLPVAPVAASPSTPPPSIPSGPTREAAATNQVAPDIPDAFKDATFKASVHVKVEIRPDGSFTPTLMTSSGNAEIDRYVLEALRKWKWKPALDHGSAAASTKYFRFDFEVN